MGSVDIPTLVLIGKIGWALIKVGIEIWGLIN